MRTHNETIETIESTFSGIKLDEESSPNKMRDVAIAAIEASKRSKVPVLFMSNPGYGKTTTVYNYAKKNGYHVEVLCGSQYAQDEILGFQANEGLDSLVIKEPEWYSRIMQNEKAGKPSILFLDELSTVCGSTQGALLQLCFERRIRGGKSLPDDCLVIAAANYKQNLPGYSEIIAPALNRFCIVNLLPSNPLEVIMEFTQGTKETDSKWPTFDNNVLSAKEENKIVLEIRQAFTGLFNTYSLGSSKGMLDIRNTQYDGIYDRDDAIPEVLNFISGRTISYLIRMILALGSMGIHAKDEIAGKIIEGLIGLGTNTWGDIDDAEARLLKYNRDIKTKFGRILDKITNKFDEAKPKVDSQLSKLMGKDTVSNRITAFLANDDTEKYLTEELADLTMAIQKKYDSLDFEKNINKIFTNPESVLEMRADMANLERLISDAENAQAILGNVNPYVIEFTKIYMMYKFYNEASEALVEFPKAVKAEDDLVS